MTKWETYPEVLETRLPRLFRVLSFAQQQAMLSVGRTGSPKVRHAHTSIRTTRKLKELGYIKFNDDTGMFELTERGRTILPWRYSFPPER